MTRPLLLVAPVTIFFLAFALLGSDGQPTQLSYQIGQEFVYKMAASVDARRADSATLQPGAGSTSSIDSSLVVRCVDEDQDSYLFVTNMFGTTVAVGQDDSPSSPSASSSSSRRVTGSADPLGEDMYFQQSKTGEILAIWYNVLDSPFFVNVKTGTINAFQTSIVPIDGQTHLLKETDTIGIHTSHISGRNDQGSVVMSKTFTQTDFTEFATDPQLESKDIIVSANQDVGIHQQGFIHSSSFNQRVLLSRPPLLKQQDAFDMFMLSTGEMSIVLQNLNAISVFKQSELHNFANIASSKSLVKDSLYGFAAKAALLAMQNPQGLNTTEALAAILSAADSTHAFSQMARLIRHLKTHKTEMNVLDGFLESSSVMASRPLRDRLFYILAALDGSDQLIRYGLSSSDGQVRMHAVVMAAKIQAPTVALADALWSVTMNAMDAQTKRTALLSYGSVLRKLGYPEAKHRRGELLLNLLKDALRAKDEQHLIVLLAAIKNAGPTVIQPSELVSITLGLPKQVPRLTLALSDLLETFGQQVDLRDVWALEDSDFPFNRSYEKSLVVGGESINIDLHGEIFAGTNFDCNHKDFNYKGLARATSDATFFASTTNIFTAQAIYGVQNGERLANELSVVFLGDTVFHESFPQIDCSEHVYNLFHSAPVASVSYTVWVSVIPVVFTASASAVLDVDWAWSICDTQLSALIKVIPGVSFVTQGDVEINLLVVRAGVELAAQLNTQVRPQAEVRGSECTVGIALWRTNEPMEAHFSSFYQTQDCPLWFFCDWGPKQTEVWWEGKIPGSSEPLYQKNWKIALPN